MYLGLWLFWKSWKRSKRREREIGFDYWVELERATNLWDNLCRASSVSWGCSGIRPVLIVYSRLHHTVKIAF